VNVGLPMSSDLHAHLQSWSLPLPVTLALVLVALVYLHGWFRLRSDSLALVSYWRIAAFMAGLSFLWIVMGSPLSALDHDLLTIHMINHLVLMTVVAPMMLVGAPGVLLQHGLPARLGRGVHNSVLCSVPCQRFLRLLKHPIFCWLFGTATVIGWHLPAVFQLAMRSRWWHNAEYASFMLAGLLFWWPVVQPVSSARDWPRWSMPLYLFLATLPCDILSAFLVFCGRVVYPSYLSAPRPFNLSPMEDQQCAGALMWVSVTIAYLLPAVVITVQILSPHSTQSHQPARGTSCRLTPPLSQLH
jgi:putative membrane protein